MFNSKLISSGHCTSSTSPQNTRLKGYRKKSKTDRNTLNRSVRGLKKTNENYEGHVLVIDDDEFSRTLVGLQLMSENYKVTFSSSLPEAINELIEVKFDFIVLDWILVEETGFNVLEKAEELFGTKLNKKSLPFYIYSTCSQIDIRFPDLNYFDYKGHWLKSINAKELKTNIKKIKKA